VSPLREVGAGQGVIYLVHDEHPRPMAAKTQADEGMPPRAVLQIADQVLAGLAGLHRLGVFHGDLRRANVFLSEPPTGDTFAGTAWIADTAIGGLIQRDTPSPIWAPQYFPPEWGGKSKEASAKADLYFLGVLLSELLLGTSAVCDAHQLSQENKTSLWASLAPQLKPVRVGRQLRFLLKMLLANVEERPADAVEAQRRIKSWQVRNQRQLGVAAVLIAMAVGSLALFVRPSNAQVERREEEARSDGSEEATDQAAEQIQGLEKRIHDLEGQVASGPPPNDAARAWRERLRPDGDFRKEQEGLNALYEELNKAHPDQAGLIKKWLAQYKEWRDRSLVWFAKDQAMRDLFRDATQQPWDAARWKPAERHLGDLRIAADIWKKWMDTPAMTSDGLDKEIPGRGESVERILRKWLDDTRGRGDWSLRLISGVAPEGHGTARTVWIKGSEWSEPLDQEWPNETKHTFSDPKEVQFKWKTGEPITMALKCDWSAWQAGRRPYRIYDDSIKGPLAICKLHFTGVSAQDDFSLKYEVVNCPGPPREAFGLGGSKQLVGGK
jgi:serine/threonine protein kinase